MGYGDETKGTARLYLSGEDRARVVLWGAKTKVRAETDMGELIGTLTRSIPVVIWLPIAAWPLWLRDGKIWAGSVGIMGEGVPDLAAEIMMARGYVVLASVTEAKRGVIGA